MRKTQNYKSHIFYWLATMSMLIIFIGSSWSQYFHATYFVVMMAPGVIATTYYFNYFLIPQYFISKKTFQFALYSFYAIILSLYFQVAVVLMAFIYIGDYKLNNLPPNASDVLLIGMIFYFVVLLGSLGLLIQQVRDKQHKIEELEIEHSKFQIDSITIKSNRKSIEIRTEQINYIESRSDYIIVHHEDKSTTTKEKISAIHDRLPPNFIRIHRSFIVNKNNIHSYTNSAITIGEEDLTIGRSYKKQVRDLL